MDGTRHKFLAGAGLAKHQNACRLGNNFDQFLKFLGGADWPMMMSSIGLLDTILTH